MSSSRPLEIYMLPFLSPGHMIPLSEIGHLFSSAGQNVTVLTTPHNASFLRKKTTNSPSFRIQTFPFPAKQVGLPDGLENFLSVNDIPTATKLYTAMTLLQSDMEGFMISRPPDVIISDMFFPWTADFALKISVPRIVFQALCIFAQTLKHAVRKSDSPHRNVGSDYEPFIIPNLPHEITMTRSQLPDYVRTPNGYTQLMEQWREAELKSYGIVVNNYAEQVGLPDGLENFLSATDMPTASKLYAGMTLLQSDIEDFMISNPPDVIISDMFFPWTAKFAVKIGVPRIVFQGVCMFAQTLKHAVRKSDSPHFNVESDFEPFVIPNLPHEITMTRSQLPDYVRTPNGYTQLMEQWREAELKSYGIVVNNYAELDSVYTDYYKDAMGGKIKIFHVGPTSLLHSSSTDKVERGHKTVITEDECLSWLGDKKPNSVVYVCFGSACIFPDTQLMEIACGLESCGYDFIWVVLGKDDEKDDDMMKWTPFDFNRTVIKTNRGLIIKGWAPQVLILNHPSVGGFVSHCGWNSVIESVSCGVPMVTWPLYAEHFYNEKLLTQVYGIGVEVGAEDWNLWVDSGKKIIKREKIEKAVRKLMNGEDKMVKEMRRKIKELGEMAKKAVQVGGSSHKNLMVLIQELKQIRDSKT